VDRCRIESVFGSVWCRKGYVSESCLGMCLDPCLGLFGAGLSLLLCLCLGHVWVCVGICLMQD